MNIPDLKTALYEGTVLFEFIKKDGTLRHARGTTCPDLVPADDTPKGKRTPSNRQPMTAKRSLFTTSTRKAGVPCVSTPSGIIIVPLNYRKKKRSKRKI